MSKSYSQFFSKNITVYAIFNGQSFNNTLTNVIVSFEQYLCYEVSVKMIMVPFTKTSDKLPYENCADPDQTAP